MSSSSYSSSDDEHYRLPRSNTFNSNSSIASSSQLEKKREIDEFSVKELSISSFDDDDRSSISTPGKPKSKWGTRITFSVLAFFGFANAYTMRVNLSVAIVAMVNSTGEGDESTYGTECATDDIETTGPNDGPFNWDSKEQGIILGAFYYGYILTQIPGGMLSERIGGKWLFGGGLLVTSILTMFTPLAAYHSKGTVIAVRVLMGLFEGASFPAMHAMIAKWIPLEERSFLASFMWAGAQAGNVVALTLSGYLADEVGWESCFYVFGALGCLWFVFWAFFVFDSPDTHPRISDDEKKYILAHLPPVTVDKLPSPPFKHFLLQPCFLAILVAHFGQNWGSYTLLTEIPTYLTNIQHFSITASGIISAVPYAFFIVLSLVFGAISDYLIRTDKLSVKAARKVFHGISAYVPAAGLIWMSFVGCNQAMAVVALCVAVSFNAAVYSGCQVNHVDLSPNYAGTLMGITNTVANCAGFLAPYYTGAFINGNQTFAAWRVVFLTGAGIYIVVATVFVIFSRGETQWWNTYWEYVKKDDSETSSTSSDNRKSE